MAAMNGKSDDTLLKTPDTDTEYPPQERATSTYMPHPTYRLPKGDERHYQQQYADMYFARLVQLKPAVEQIAREPFDAIEIGGEQCRRVERVLDVRQGELCWVIGTIYMEMPLKPNVLEDIGKEHWIAAPPPRVKYDSGAGLAVEGAHGAHAAGTGGAGTQIMLEDESGRLRLVGSELGGFMLVTGAIVAVVGTENKDGDFEVLDLRVPDLPRQPQRWETEDGEAALKGEKVATQDREKAGKLALVSGLGISGDEGDSLTLDLLLEYLLGEAATPKEQETAAGISRLIIAGNALSQSSPIPTRESMAALAAKKGGRKTYGYDSSSYNAAPTDRLDQWLATLLPSMPVTLIPGEQDPTSTSLPQQPIHPAMFPHSRSYMIPPATTPKASDEVGWLDSQTNPADLSVDGWRLLGNGGQPLDDVYKYIPNCENRLDMMEAMLRWRLTAPTAPDTLWCYPFQDGDAFVMKECPHLFFVGNQPKFETTVIEGPVGQQVRLVAVPNFKDTGEVVLIDMETLVPEVIKFDVFEG
ncbi:hypothetical protein KC332_g8305 [Hortaea werneckii]|uniref:DNA-directed DNA polymerase n=1 Tax=Hortaea werneckii TaxID=91943 RepID=A0A3M7IEL2_HORWE|nr:hypothetical protein KC358_g4943 [Hortaea werneckii]KAI6846414.1 hypothetical protein KC350_g3944 [Hortaea werneckii]KAI6926945.1 hypothetical protein KC348_g8516 [Hortaea werneckii]KAI6933905.1 hypothetical protein KC341_g7966 [Hortaea werneckii]KAI6974593.1 hypothetical protein KC321_g5031 [Hortaea werneckii]